MEPFVDITPDDLCRFGFEESRIIGLLVIRAMAPFANAKMENYLFPGLFHRWFYCQLHRRTKLERSSARIRGWTVDKLEGEVGE